jgi:TolB-like protein
MKTNSMILKTLVIISIFLTALIAEEQTRVEKTTEVSGYGVNKTAAIENALVEAVKQKNGAFIQSVKGVFRSYSQKSVSTDEDSAHITKMHDGMAQQVRVATQGFIDNYEVVDIIKHESDYEAIIKIYTVEYKAPGNSAHQRRKIVIVPSYVENYAFSVLGKVKSSKEVSYNLTQELINSIAQTRKFSVLDREENRAYNDEKRVILSPDAHKDEILKLGNVLGTDYLVVSNLKEFKVANQKTMIKSIGQEINKLKVLATVQYKIITMATKQIKWSNTMDFEFEPTGNDDKQIFYNAMKKISKDLTYEIIENVYPIRVDNISGNGDAILNQTTKVGAIYDVYAMGDKLFDSYTKEFLGYDEIKTGTIEIVRSLPKVSYGRVIEGDVQKNSICREAKITPKKKVKAFCSGR